MMQISRHEYEVLRLFGSAWADAPTSSPDVESMARRGLLQRDRRVWVIEDGDNGSRFRVARRMTDVELMAQCQYRLTRRGRFAIDNAHLTIKDY